MLARLGLTPDDRDRAIRRLVELTAHDMYRASALVALYSIGYSNVLELLDEHGNPDSMWDLATTVELLVEMQETGRAVSVAEQIGRQGMGMGGSPDEQYSATSYVMERVGRALRRADNLSDYIVALRTCVGDEAEWLRLFAGRALLHTEFNADALDAFGSLVSPTSRPVSTLAKDATGEDSEVAREAWEKIAALLRVNTDAGAAAKEARRILMGTSSPRPEPLTPTLMKTSRFDAAGDATGWADSLPPATYTTRIGRPTYRSPVGCGSPAGGMPPGATFRTRVARAVGGTNARGTSVGLKGGLRWGHRLVAAPDLEAVTGASVRAL